MVQISHSGKHSKQGNTVVKSIAWKTIVLSNGTHCLGMEYVQIFPHFLCPIHSYRNLIAFRPQHRFICQTPSSSDAKPIWDLESDPKRIEFEGNGFPFLQPTLRQVWREQHPVQGNCQRGPLSHGSLWVLHAAPPWDAGGQTARCPCCSQAWGAEGNRALDMTRGGVEPHSLEDVSQACWSRKWFSLGEEYSEPIKHPPEL